MYIVADIGGTKTRVAESGDLVAFSEPIIEETPAGHEDGLRLIIENAKKLALGQKIQAVSIGIAGALAVNKRSLVSSRKLTDWCGHPIVESIEKSLETSVYMENDAALVGLGEATSGAGIGAPVLVYITVSTGVNGVRIVDGKIDRAERGFEIGGQYLLVGDEMETWEDLISGSSLEKRLGKHPRDLGKDAPEWNDLALLTAIGVHNAILYWSPDKVVLGGSMFNDIGIPVERVREHVRTMMKKFPETPDIVHSSLGEIGGLWGGLALLKQKQQN